MVRTLPLLLLLLFAPATGCRPSPPGSANAEPAGQAAATPVPPDFRMVFGQGGGFAGRWEGYTIEADGTVLAWAGRVEGDEARPAGTLRSEQVEALWQRIREADYFEQQREEAGNMTAFMEVTAAGRTHRLSWVPTVEGLEPAASPIEELYRYSRDMASAVGGR